MKKQNLKSKISNMKGSKGITLVALIITIVVLLILAVVAISAVQDTDIIGYAKNSEQKYSAGRIKESIELLRYEAYLKSNGTDGTISADTLKDQEWFNDESITIEEDEQTGLITKITIASTGEYIIVNEQKIDYAKRLEELIISYMQLNQEKNEDITEDEKQRIEEEMEKLYSEGMTIIGTDVESFYRNENDEKEYAFVYSKTNGHFFRRFFGANGEVEIINVEKTDEANEVLKTLLEFKKYLEEEFIGKTYEEIKTMINQNQLVSYIKDGFEPSNDFENLRGIVPAAGDIYIMYDIESDIFSDAYYDIGFTLITEPHRDKVKSIITGNNLLGS